MQTNLDWISLKYFKPCLSKLKKYGSKVSSIPVAPQTFDSNNFLSFCKYKDVLLLPPSQFSALPSVLQDSVIISRENGHFGFKLPGLQARLSLYQGTRRRSIEPFLYRNSQQIIRLHPISVVYDATVAKRGLAVLMEAPKAAHQENTVQCHATRFKSHTEELTISARQRSFTKQTVHDHRTSKVKHDRKQLYWC